MAGATRYDELARAIDRALSAAAATAAGHRALRARAIRERWRCRHGRRRSRARPSVPPSAVIRFANALGYPTATPTCSASIRERLVARIGHLPRAHRVAAPRRRATSAAKAVLPDFVDDSIARPRAPARALRRRGALRRAPCALLAGAERIYVLAQRRAFPVAGYLAYALAQLELRALRCSTRVGGMLRQQARAHAARATCWSPRASATTRAEVIELAASSHAGAA